MRIAVATTDGVVVNEHFGTTGNFSMYDIVSGGPVKVGEISVKPLSTGDRKHTFDPDRFNSIAEALKGCERVYVSQIGERPAQELKNRGMEPVVFCGEIKSICL